MPEKKEELFDFIQRVNLTDNLILHDNDLDKYLNEVSQIEKNRLEAERYEWRNSKAGVSENINKNIIRNATHLKIAWKA